MSNIYFFVNLSFLIALKERCYFALVEIYFHLISVGVRLQWKAQNGAKWMGNTDVMQNAECSDNNNDYAARGLHCSCCCAVCLWMLLGVNVINEAVDEKVFADWVGIPNQTELNIARWKNLELKRGPKRLGKLLSVTSSSVEMFVMEMWWWL